VPELEPLFTWMAHQLEHGPGVVRLSGLPVNRFSGDALRRLFWGFCVNLGTPVYQTSAGEVLGEVKDETGTDAIAGSLPDAVERYGTNAGQTGFKQILGWARDEKLTIRQLYQRFVGARGQRSVVGTASMIVDEMQAWFDGYGVDGFLIQPSTLPGGLDDFVELVIPELQDRGLFRFKYESPTLRDNLGLPRPASRYQR
jgi:alkanesulfonate monooxygenase SsuD/methylene tetrahydromethanopterin reductase-like flavin-dependent oxidoreductase (luciferase family)